MSRLYSEYIKYLLEFSFSDTLTSVKEQPKQKGIHLTFLLPDQLCSPFTSYHIFTLKGISFLWFQLVQICSSGPDHYSVFWNSKLWTKPQTMKVSLRVTSYVIQLETFSASYHKNHKFLEINELNFFFIFKILQEFSHGTCVYLYFLICGI